MRLYEIIKVIEERFPTSLAMEWDNVGLLVGDENREIKRIFLTLDVTEETLDEAILSGCELILSHHPVMFAPRRKITAADSEGRLLLKAIENKISVYAAHTNCDVAEGGINAFLAELFGLKNAEPLEENGLGRIGNLEREVSFSDFCAKCSEYLNTPIKFSGAKAVVSRVAIGSGACADSIPTAIKMGADVMLTADVKYHEMLDYSRQINIVDAGHYPTEIFVTDIFEEALSGLPVEIVKTKEQDVIKFWSCN